MSKHTCHYCAIFRSIPEKYRSLELVSKNTKISSRFCPNLRKNVTNSDKACSHFLPSKYFFCNRDHVWMNVLACLNKMKTGKCRCSQKGEIMDALRGQSLRAINGEKPQLIRRAS